MARPQALLRAAYFASQLLASAAEVCEAARMLARGFGYDAEHLEDLDCVYEAWDGSGLPGRRRGDSITLPARIVYAASLAVSAHREASTRGAVDLVTAAAGRRLDPIIAAAILDDPEGLFAVLDAEGSLWNAVIAAEPEGPGWVAEAEIDTTLRAVADFVDLKASCLVGHSAGVAALACTAARLAGLPAEQVTAVRRAGWLHDVGRIGVSSGVWARPGRLPPRVGTGQAAP
jgi:HD-GYP domain-containing protein (c-di-GMP phosphodiesterase class II)